MNEFGSTPQEYLDQHLEPKNEEPANEPRPFLRDGSTPDYSSAEKFFNHNDGIKSLSLDYEPLDDEFVERLLKMSQQNNDSIKIEELSSFFSSPVFQLTDLHLSATNTDKQFQLSSLFPPEHKTYILFNPIHSETANIRTDTESDASLILLGTDPATLNGLLSLLHEVGHLAEGRDTKKERERMQNSLLSQTEAADLLASERDAWAFALNKLRPFLDAEDRSFALTEIHRSALQSYSNAIRQSTMPRWLDNTINFLKQILAKSEN